MNSLAQNVLYIYLFVFIAMTFFDVVCIFFRRANEKRLEHKEEKIKKLIEKEDINKLSSKHLKYLKRHLKKVDTFIAFSNVLKDMSEEDRKVYLPQLKPIFLKIVSSYEKADEIKQTFFAYVLAEYPYIYSDSHNQIIHYLISSTTSSSIFLREHALTALYGVGNETYVKEALQKMNFLRIKHHPKLLTDGFMKFTGNQESFVQMLEELFPSLVENYKVACINYFNYKKVPCKDFVYDLLISSNESKEVRIASIRYFGSVKLEKAKEKMYEFLKSDMKNWEYAAISASSLKNYPGKDTLNSLRESVKSRNWYVRSNSAATIINIANEKELEEMLKIDDRYARDSLHYQLNLKEKRS